MAGKIFINYRREDAAGFTRLLTDRLEQSFPESLFRDVDGIRAGQNFVQVIEDQISACNAMLVLIGANWLTVKDEDGRRRLDNPKDLLRIEVASALKLRKHVIPVLLQKTDMPRAAALPKPLKALAGLHAARLTDERFSTDVRELIETLAGLLKETGQAGKERESLDAIASVSPERIARELAELRAAQDAAERARIESRLIRTFCGHRDAVLSVAFSPDGHTALSGSDDHTLKLWDVADGQEIRTLTGHSDKVQSVAVSPDGRFALSGSADKTLKLWNITTGKELLTFCGHIYWVNSVAFSPDGRSALSGGGDETVKLWDIATGRELRTFKGHTATIHSVAFSPDGSSALSGSRDDTIKLWDIATGNEIRTFAGQDEYSSLNVFSVAFSPDGGRALSGGLHNWVRLWDVATGKEIGLCWSHSSGVNSVAYAPNGRSALSGSSDHTLKLWDVPTGKVIRTFTGHTNGVLSVAYSPDGRSALSGSRDRALKLWDLTGL